MDDKMMKMMMDKKSGAKKLDPGYKKVKMDLLKGLHGDMGKMLGEDFKGLKKVTVAAPDSEGLAEGLDKAEDMLGMDHPESEDSSEMCPACGEACEGHEVSELDAKIAELEALKAKMSMKA